ncbi:excinuclease ABC subunit UvrA [Georgenia sp. Z1491]|uniref:excinuclease ABC subunit UvrA n=1 Tax=Georgenia sp. Z1491 TaxID=3416707 RepID=UPI003CF09B47
MESDDQPAEIRVRGAAVHNLKGVDVDIPLRRLVGIAGVSGSGKSSLAMGVLYAEGSRRYLEALSTYTRRRLAQAPRAAVDSVEHVPAALALRQRPGVPGVRSTFGTTTELLSVLRLMFSRLASHRCPNGHAHPPTLDVAAEVPLTCPHCGVVFDPPGAEDLSFNSAGACPTCAGTSVVRDVDDATLVPDPSLTIDEGAVLPWRTFNFNVQPDIVREMGVRTDVPYRDLTDDERAVVLDGPEEKRHITVSTRNGVHELDFTFRNARLTVTKQLERATDEKRLARVGKFLTVGVCRACGGTRLSEAARAPRIGPAGLAEVTAYTLDDALDWAASVESALPADMRPMAGSLVTSFRDMGARLVELGLGYLSLDRAGSTLSTGERQRAQLARAVRNRTTGVLYVLDEPSIGLHPANVEGLLGVVRDLLADGNSVVLVDHDVAVLREADHLVEIGPGAGADGGRVVASGSVAEVTGARASRLGGFLDGSEPVLVRERTPAGDVFADGAIHLGTEWIHTVHPLTVDVPRARLTAVTGASGSGKTTLVLEGLVPALAAVAAGERPPAHVTDVDPAGIERVQLVDATPIGINVRSTVATYSGAMDELRRTFAKAPSAVEQGLTAADLSHNTGSLRCPRCEGTGQITLDVQFLPDVDIACPDCEGTRYAPEAFLVRRPVPGGGEISLPEVLALTAAEAADALDDVAPVARRLRTLTDLGLGYLTLGEATPALSGGEAQRLKLSTELGRRQGGTMFVLDEPSVGLHPLDVRVLLAVLQRLVDRGATVVVIEHDLDLVANADHVIDMGPGGGEDGGRIVVTGTPEQVAAEPASLTGRYLARHLGQE